MATIYTVGHGARSAEELVAILKEAGVQALVDVRAFPSSKRHPQFSRQPLSAALESSASRTTGRGKRSAVIAKAAMWSICKANHSDGRPKG